MGRPSATDRFFVAPIVNGEVAKGRTLNFTGKSIRTTEDADNDQTNVIIGGVGMVDITAAKYDVDPDDITAACGAAAADALATGGHGIFIPPRADFDGEPFWGKTGFTDVDCLNNRSFFVQGVPGATMIKVDGTDAFRISNSNAVLAYRGLLFASADPDGGLDSPNVIDLEQARLCIMHDCQFFGFRCNANQFGVARIKGDSVDVRRNLFVGCDYTGTAGQGGVLSVTGQRDSCIIESNRFVASDTLRGTTYAKTGSAENMHLWVGGQGQDGEATPFGLVRIISNWFDRAAPAGTIGLLPQRDAWGLSLTDFVIDQALVEGNTFSPDTGDIAIVADYLLELILGPNDFGNNIDGDVILSMSNALAACIRHVKVKPSTVTKKIQWQVPAPLKVETYECSGVVRDEALAVPTFDSDVTNGQRTILHGDPVSILGNKLAAHWRGDSVTLVSGDADVLVDRSANKFDLPYAGGVRPTHNTGGLNGQEYVSSDGTSYFAILQALLDSGPFSIWWVGNVASTAARRGIFSVGDDSSGGIAINTDGSGNRGIFYAGVNDLSDGAYTGTTNEKWFASFDGNGTNLLEVNDVAQVLSNPTIKPLAPPQATYVFALGGSFRGVQDLYDLIVMKGTPTPHEKTLVNEYLFNRYGL